MSSIIKVDIIEERTSGGSVTLNSPINVKSYDAAGIAALTPSSGDLIYDSDNNALKVYKSSSWEEVGGTVDLSSYATKDDAFAYQLIIGD
jgi:hypothetical protein